MIKKTCIPTALALYLLHALSTAGYTVIASADTSAKFIRQQNGPDYPCDVHSWYLIRTDALTKTGLGIRDGPSDDSFR